VIVGFGSMITADFGIFKPAHELRDRVRKEQRVRVERHDDVTVGNGDSVVER